MLRVQEALSRILTLVSPLETEWIPIGQAIGRVAAERIAAARTVPPWDNSAMDGYAVRAADVRECPARLKVTGVVYAGQVSSHKIIAGACARVFTGAPIPAGADAVVMQEKTRAADDWVEVLEPVAPGSFIRSKGEDAQVGEELLPAGTPIGIPEAGLLWSQNQFNIGVHRRPAVAILSTGDELAELGEPSPDRIIDSNSMCLEAAVTKAGGFPTRLGIAKDSPDAIYEKLTAALHFDVLLTSAGVSVGEHDFVREALARYGVDMAFWQVAIKPGKPLAVGRRGSTVYFGLPGNPTSSLVSFELFVRPALRRMLGHVSSLPLTVPGRLAERVTKPKGLTHYLRAAAETREGELWAKPLKSQTSGALRSSAGATHLIVFPEDSTELPLDSHVQLIPLSWSGS
jgi:molybdopterin molybdotransferase